MLQRHVNQHFAYDDVQAEAAGSGRNTARKSGGGHGGFPAKKENPKNVSESTKNLKRAGVKLKKRNLLFSARIFDFFDVGVMAGIRHGVYDLEVRSAGLGLAKADAGGEEVEFKPRIAALRTNAKNGRKEALVRWTPVEMLVSNLFVPFVKKVINLTPLSCVLKVMLSKAFSTW